jgi:hypothetical protein
MENSKTKNKIRGIIVDGRKKIKIALLKERL